MKDQIRTARNALQSADDALYTTRNRLLGRERQLDRARRTAGPSRGEEDGSALRELEREVADLRDRVSRSRELVRSRRSELDALVGEFVLPSSHRALVAQLDDRLPCLLLPLRIETRLMGPPGERELWLRVYPDDIAVYTHEKVLARDEADAGVDYWTERRQALDVEDPAERERLEDGAWRALVEGYGGTRAGWIAGEIKREVLDRFDGEADFSFLLLRPRIVEILGDPALEPPAKRNAVLALLDSDHPLVPFIGARVSELLQADAAVSDATVQAIIQVMRDQTLTFLGFDLDALKTASWTRAPRSGIMPDRFVVLGFSGDARLEEPFPAAVPDPLVLGPDPHELEAQLAQQDGDLKMGADYAWISDFEAAIATGMAIRVALPEPFSSSGFDRLMVVGMRVTSDPEENKVLLERLIENHRFAPEGMGFLPQGTPTNNTGEERSGFSLDDVDEEADMEGGVGDPPFTASEEDLEKTDAQRLAEAWDVDLDQLSRLANAGGMDVAQAKMFNRALWPATLGYYLEELLEAEPPTIRRVRDFFTHHVVGRGGLPAIRVGNQPYGILVTSDFGRWSVNDEVDGEDSGFLRAAHGMLRKVEEQWQALVPKVAHVDAGGDPFANLLDMLGLHASSVAFRRRIGTYRTVLWNLAHLRFGRDFPASDPVARYFEEISSRGIALFNELGIELPRLARIFGLFFSKSTSDLASPVVDDVETADDERLSESLALPAKYAVPAAEGEIEEEVEEAIELRNYIGWLVSHDIAELKAQAFADGVGSSLPVPRPLLYRMLHRALLLAHYQATMDLYEARQMVDRRVRREVDLPNVEAGRTVTRWEFMEARIGDIMPETSGSTLAIGDFLATPEGAEQPAAFTLTEVRAAIASLEHLSTAALERLFAEHLDLCSYRLDGWQTAIFAHRLEQLNRQRGDAVEDRPRRTGVHLGAYGWLENLRPGPALAPVSPDEVPPGLREDGVTVFEQAGNGGFIHSPSMNHAVAAAILRNGYLTHVATLDAKQFSVRLTSERVRTARSFLEGVRNGQTLGALLGYQFERALHDRYVIDGTALAQFILAFRKKYPLVADRITPDEANESIDRREASQVVDGYALLEATLLEEPPIGYPFGVNGLPADPASAPARAIVAEVERLNDTLDAIADLSLAEGVYQVSQGNYDRAGALLEALVEGKSPPEPEIARTPRSGAVVNHRVCLHFRTDLHGGPTPRSFAAPGLDRWLADCIGSLDTILFSIRYELDDQVTALGLDELGLEPIDLVLMVGDDAGAIRGGEQINDVTELESRIDFAYRRKRIADDPSWDHSGRSIIAFRSRDGFEDAEPDARTFFEVLPMLRTVRNVVTGCRPLGADDYRLPSETTSDPDAGGNPAGWDPGPLEAVLDHTATELGLALDGLRAAIDSLPPDALSEDPAVAGDLDGVVDYDVLRDRLMAVSLFGIPDAFPRNALLPDAGPDATDAERLARLRAQQALIRQGIRTHAEGTSRRDEALRLRHLEHLAPEAAAGLSVAENVEIYQASAALLLGDAFRLVPTFAFQNVAELAAADAFCNEAPAESSLMRFTQERRSAEAAGDRIVDWRPLTVDDWVHGTGSVRERVHGLDRLGTLRTAFGRPQPLVRALQLPFDERAHWVAVEYPEVSPESLDDPDTFVPEGEFLSFVRELPPDYSLSGTQAGLLVDEWNEVIPNRVETTGIALNYNQPNTEPPQTVLLAVSPTIDGAWSWDDLVGTLTDTFDRARRRAVEPDFLQETPYAQLLPAILSTFTRFPFATISTDLSSQQATTAFEPS